MQVGRLKFLEIISTPADDGTPNSKPSLCKKSAMSEKT